MLAQMVPECDECGSRLFGQYSTVEGFRDPSGQVDATLVRISRSVTPPRQSAADCVANLYAAVQVFQDLNRNTSIIVAAPVRLHKVDELIAELSGFLFVDTGRWSSAGRTKPDEAQLEVRNRDSIGTTHSRSTSRTTRSHSVALQAGQEQSRWGAVLLVQLSEEPVDTGPRSPRELRSQSVPATAVWGFPADPAKNTPSR